MKTLILKSAIGLALLGVIACGIYWLHIRWKVWWQRRRLLTQLFNLPPVNMDFTTPEGAILCLEDACRRRDVPMAIACRDFVTEAKVWIQERGHLSDETQAAMQVETAKVLEKAFRDGLNRPWPIDWKRAKSYFPSREADGDGVIVNEYTLVPGGQLLQRRFLVAQKADDWRIVKQLPVFPEIPG